MRLEIIGVNGDVHPSTIPGLVDSFTVKRGEITRVTFTATKPGLYPIICTKHTPNMQGTLVVASRCGRNPAATRSATPGTCVERISA